MKNKFSLAAPVPLSYAYLLTLTVESISTIISFFDDFLHPLNQICKKDGSDLIKQVTFYKQVFELMPDKHTSQALHRFLIPNFPEKSVIYLPVFF